VPTKCAPQNERGLKHLLAEKGAHALAVREEEPGSGVARIHDHGGAREAYEGGLKKDPHTAAQTHTQGAWAWIHAPQHPSPSNFQGLQLPCPPNFHVPQTCKPPKLQGLLKLPRPANFQDTRTSNLPPPLASPPSSTAAGEPT